MRVCIVHVCVFVSTHVCACVCVCATCVFVCLSMFACIIV